jgi:hypothetical protein
VGVKVIDTRHGPIRSYLDKHGCGYVIQANVLGFRWVWKEPGEVDEFGDFLPTEAEALRDAAADWDSNGNIGDKRGATMKAVATRLEKQERENVQPGGSSHE